MKGTKETAEAKEQFIELERKMWIWKRRYVISTYIKLFK